MRFTQPHIVCFGKDQLLLRTRRLLLEQAGYVAHATTELQAAISWLRGVDVSILVLCHTLSGSEVEAVFKAHEEAHSIAVVLCLSAGEWSFNFDCKEIYDARRGPGQFLAEIDKLNAHHVSAA